MRKIIAIILILSMLLTGCGSRVGEEKKETDKKSNPTEGVTVEATPEISIPEEEVGDDTPYVYRAEFASLNDDALFRYAKDTIYEELVSALDSEQYLVEDIQFTYISKEYIQELEYNSRQNVFFGYTLAELDEYFQGEKYVFTVGENGQTIVKSFEGYDDTFERALRNIAVGSGVILVCATVSIVSGGLGAPAVSMIFAASAKTGTICAASMGAFGSITAGAITGIKTKDMDQALKAAALSGSEGFKWGAIIGAVSGGATETIGLKQATKNGLTMNEAALIQKESKYPLDVISEIHNMDEYQALMAANAKPVMINGQTALLRGDIDPNLVDEYGRTNLMRMQKGLSPLDASGKSIELHHIGQANDATLITLTSAEHDSTALHGFETVSQIDRDAFNITRNKFWKTVANMITEGVY